MLKSFDPKGTHDIVFVPVALNYDRVLEDRTLLRSLDTRGAAARRPGSPRAPRWPSGSSQVGLMLRGQWFRFGYACVNFGGLISARDWLAADGKAGGGDLPRLDKDQRFEVIGRLANDVMGEIARLVPVAAGVANGDGTPRGRGAARRAASSRWGASDLIAHFEGRGAKLYLPRGDRDYAIHVGLRMLSLRHLVHEGDDGLFAVVAAERPILAYYANAIAHLR